MTTLADQVGQLLALAGSRAATTQDPWRRQAIVQAAAAVYAAWNDDSAVPGPTGASSCVAWGHANASVLDRARYRMLCGTWEDRFRAALDALMAALAAAGHADVAEVAGSVAAQAGTMGDQAVVVTTPQPGDTPKWLIVALVAVIAAALARVAGVFR